MLKAFVYVRLSYCDALTNISDALSNRTGAFGLGAKELCTIHIQRLLTKADVQQVTSRASLNVKSTSAVAISFFLRTLCNAIEKKTRRVTVCAVRLSWYHGQ